MKLKSIVFAAFAVSQFFGSAQAEMVTLQPRAVVELFTSQGCSSCPPADALLSELAQRDDVLALAYHVDYWDYIGWKDTFASPAFSAHQRAYAACWNKDRVYTPQMIVNGSVGVVGSRRNAVQAELVDVTLPVAMEISYAAGAISVAIDGQQDFPESTVWLVTFRDAVDVEISRGENAGKEITYSQIVTGRQPVGMWDPQNGLNAKFALRDILRDSDQGGANGAALILQQDLDGLPGPILAAASFAL